MNPQEKAAGMRHPDPGTVSPWVLRFAHLVPPGGTVLDLAAGGGRHSRFFLKRGHTVLAVDREIEALADIEDQRLSLMKADLESGPWPFGERRFSGIVVTNYLHRPLLAPLVAAVEDGGAFIYETFAEGNAAFGRPSNPAFLLRPGELLEAVGGALEVVAYEHGHVERPRPAVVQRIAAVRNPSSSLIRRIDPGAEGA
ncbi:MAG TPA: class I SAM-dependent methyltransferase [Alphaproteobacteria bacterium]|nr:class I SAM-dependent methyltransferase [Alphaproteobacteria bacterium]